MSLLKSFGFKSNMGIDEIPEEVLSLFTSCVGTNKQLNYTSEIVFNALKGRIALDGSFNIDAYESTVKRNICFSDNKRKKKELFIDYTSSADDYESVIKEGGIQVDRLYIEGVKDSFEELMDNDELRSAVKNIKKLNSEFIIVEEIDLIETIRLSLKGIPQAINDIKHMCDFYPNVAESVKTVLSSGLSFDEVFA